MKGMVTEYIPEMIVSSQPLRTLARRVASLVATLVPSSAVRQLSKLSATALGLTVRCWLQGRLHLMPWAEALRKLPRRQLQNLTTELGLGAFADARSRFTRVKILASASQEHVKRRLIGALGAAPPPSNATLAEIVAKCIANISGDVQTVDNASGAFPEDVDFFPRVEVALTALGHDVVKAMTRTYFPEVGYPCLTPAALAKRMAKVLPTVVPPVAAAGILGSKGADFFGALCHWLEVRMQQMPWVAAMRQMSASELTALRAKMGLAAPVSISLRRLVAATTAAAMRNHSLRAELRCELRCAAGKARTEIGYLDECPEGVRKVVAHAWTGT